MSWFRLSALMCLSAVLVVGCASGPSGGGGGGGVTDQNGETEGATLTLTADVLEGGGGGGYVWADPDWDSYDIGDTVVLTAEPEQGYEFDHWAGDASGDENPFEITITGDLDIEAVFVTEGGGEGEGEGEPPPDEVEHPGAVIADHQAADAFDSIPESYIQGAKSDFRIFYGHTSHGSQVVTGMNMVDTGPGTLSIEEDDGVDLGYEGDLAWVDITRNILDEPGSDINMVMWSWCGGVSDNTEEGIDAYLQAMSDLEDDYPDVLFVYMTGHLDGTGSSENLHTRNEQIRDYCREHGKILFDFADIETYDPDGNSYLDPDGSDWCEWCADWCESHSCSTGDCVDDDDCQHAHCFNCYRKGQAFWWMMARIAGWDGE